MSATFGFMKFLQACKNFMNQKSQTNFHGIKYINLIYIHLFIINSLELFISSLADGFFSLESDWQQVSRILLSILAVLNNAVVWMVSTRPPTSKSSRLFSNPLVIVQNAPIPIDIIATCMFHSFFQFPSKVEVLIPLFTFFRFYSVVSRNSKVNNFASSLCFCWLLLSLVIII